MVSRPVDREYLRVSKDRSGRYKSLAEQHDENQHDATRMGHDLHPDPYRDAVSASRYAAKARDDFERLIADLRGDRFGADNLRLWESSRGSRQVGEWVELIDLCEKRRVGIVVTTHGRRYSPANGRDRKALLEDAVASEYSSWETSERCRRASAASVAAGTPYGKIPYGYRREYDPTTGQLVAQVPHEDTAPVVREIHRRLLAGEALYSIAIDLTNRGIPAPRGAGRWDPTQVRRIGTNPTYAGLRTHKGKVVGPATWECLVSEDDHRVLKGRLGDPARRTWRDGSVKHLLSGIAECGVCGGMCLRRKNRDTPSYVCVKGFCVARAQRQLDLYVTKVVVARLSKPDALDLFTPPQDETAAEAAAEARRLRAQLDEFYDLAGTGQISPAGLAKVEAKILPQIEAAERRSVPRGVPSVVTELAGPDAGDRWELLTMPQRRDAIRSMLVPRILLSGKGTRRFDPDRIEIVWRDGTF